MGTDVCDYCGYAPVRSTAELLYVDMSMKPGVVAKLCTQCYVDIADAAEEPHG